MIAVLFDLLWLLADLDHCRRWQPTAHGPRCADVRLEARCLWSGWHLTAQGIPVCVRACGDERPTS